MFLRRLIGEGERVLALVSYGCTTKALLIIYINAKRGKGRKALSYQSVKKLNYCHFDQK